jgi:hypothetical protein
MEPGASALLRAGLSADFVFFERNLAGGAFLIAF